MHVSDILVLGMVAAVSIGALGFYPEEPPFRRPDSLAVALTIGQAVPLIAWRSWPIGAFLGSWALTVGFLTAGYPPFSPVWLAPLVAVFGMALHGSARLAMIGVSFSAAMVLLLMLGSSFRGIEGSTMEATVVSLAFVVLAIVGDGLRRRREGVEALRRAASERSAERERRAAKAVAAERSRIARELHDVVGHGLSVIVLQAGGAREVLAQDPAAARRALSVIESAGRDALGEMRRTLELLRADGDTEPFQPIPDLQTLPKLAAGFEASGLEVRFHTKDAPARIPPGIGLSAYRVVQEALTNVLKHSSAGRADVVLTGSTERLVVHVHDPGPSRSADGPSGFGLVGMRERVEIFGGSLTADHRPDGGFEVIAVFPLEDDRV